MIEKSLEDENVKSQFIDKMSAKVNKQMMILHIEALLVEMEDEKDIILQTAAKLVSFIKANAIAPFNDMYKVSFRYISQVKEKSKPYYVIININTAMVYQPSGGSRC